MEPTFSINATRAREAPIWKSASVRSVPSVKQRFEITLEGHDDVQPVVIRLRQALKLLLRCFRLTCTEIRETTTEATTEKRR